MTITHKFFFQMSVLGVIPADILSSSNRHRSHSRLYDWHAVDYDEELLIDLSYCGGSKTLLQNNASNLKSLFQEKKGLVPLGVCSTSTPLQNFKFSENKESGINESDVVKKFIGCCKIDSPSSSHTSSTLGHSYCPHVDLASDCDLFTSPLPCKSLEFDGDDSDSLSAYESDQDVLDSKGVTSALTSSTTIKSEFDKKTTTTTGIGHTPDDRLCSQSCCSSLDSGYDTHPSSTLSSLEDISCQLFNNKTIYPASLNNFVKSIEKKRTMINRPLLEKVISHFSPKEPQALIGRRIGVESFDIVAGLHEKNMYHALKKILSDLPDQDLRSFCDVSDTWRSALLTDTKARRRRLKYIRSRECKPENKVSNDKSPSLKTLLSKFHSVI